MFKVNNKDNKTAKLSSFCCLYVLLTWKKLKFYVDMKMA